MEKKPLAVSISFCILNSLYSSKKNYMIVYPHSLLASGKGIVHDSLYQLYRLFTENCTRWFVEGDGNDIQNALAEWTGQRSVPNLFIKGQNIGGCDGIPRFLLIHHTCFTALYSLGSGWILVNLLLFICLHLLYSCSNNEVAQEWEARAFVDWSWSSCCCQ